MDVELGFVGSFGLSSQPHIHLIGVVAEPDQDVIVGPFRANGDVEVVPAVGVGLQFALVDRAVFLGELKLRILIAILQFEAEVHDLIMALDEVQSVAVEERHLIGPAVHVKGLPFSVGTAVFQSRDALQLVDIDSFVHPLAAVNAVKGDVALNIGHINGVLSAQQAVHHHDIVIRDGHRAAVQLGNRRGVVRVQRKLQSLFLGAVQNGEGLDQLGHAKVVGAVDGQLQGFTLLDLDRKLLNDIHAGGLEVLALVHGVNVGDGFGGNGDLGVLQIAGPGEIEAVGAAFGHGFRLTALKLFQFVAIGQRQRFVGIQALGDLQFVQLIALRDVDEEVSRTSLQHGEVQRIAASQLFQLADFKVDAKRVVLAGGVPQPHAVAGVVAENERDAIVASGRRTAQGRRRGSRDRCGLQIILLHGRLFGGLGAVRHGLAVVHNRLGAVHGGLGAVHSGLSAVHSGLGVVHHGLGGIHNRLFIRDGRDSAAHGHFVAREHTGRGQREDQPKREHQADKPLSRS